MGKQGLLWTWELCPVQGKKVYLADLALAPGLKCSRFLCWMVAWLWTPSCSEGSSYVWRGMAALRAHHTLSLVGLKTLTRFLPSFPFLGEAVSCWWGSPNSNAPVTSPAFLGLSLSSSSVSVPQLPVPCGLSSQPIKPRTVSRMFSAARFSSLGPSSLPEEIPLSGNTLASLPPGCEAFSGQSASLCPLLPPFGLHQLLLYIQCSVSLKQVLYLVMYISL